MKKKNSKIILFLIVFNLLFLLSFLAFNGHAAVEEFEPEHGWAIHVDGEIKTSKREWENATKEIIHIKGTSPKDVGIAADVWVMQNNSDLYISVQFELEQHNPEEFVGIMISSDDSESNSSFIDAKIVQFTDLSITSQHYQFNDYHVINNVFYLDSEKNGDGAAQLEDNKIIYEFEIPVNDSDDDRDAELDFGEIYAFKIIYGEGLNYPSDIKKSNIITIEIEYPPKEKPNLWVLVHNILCIIIYIGLGTIFGLYIYKIVSIKRKFRKKVSG